ncbi:LacI family DNA-binding transcriptional regulator [Bacillus sp. SD088]|uniref:LacI family DNA-binding transcriptional regulator n=1 Tax=Bacillus sp. SD088 TaxID=2782012 RepID=UPI001A9734FB|nr:LacI family DNA-binding transcriptional regulator [Bacillus sp. SD088]MBO0995664.1 LacI family DNA-binding transcriptional regulator [Bacillus sp. SD088]
MKNKKDFVTLKDIAKISGVSPATVSLALSGDKRVNIKTRKHVEEVAKKLNYVPNEIGRSLRSKKADTIALIFPDTTHNAFTHPYFVDLLEGIMDTVVKNDFHLMISTTPKMDDEKASYSKILKNRRADGFILWPSTIEDKNIFEIIGSGFPLVYLSKWHYDNIVTVERDDYGGAYDATKHLLNLGRKKIVHISGPMDYQVSVDRLEGYRKALEESKFLFDPSLVFEREFVYENGVEVVEALLQSNVEFDAIFAGNDLMAIGAMDALQKAGLNVPEHVAVIGCDDIDMASMTIPSLTTIYQPMRKIGELAAQKIINILKNEEVNEVQTIVPTELVVRETCGAKN